jgi:uncharacterized protein (TIGR00369 family)
VSAVAEAPTGLEQIGALLAGELEPPPIAALMGFELVEAAEGRAVFESVPGAELYNPIGTVHGGYAATLLDSALGCAVHTTLPAGGAYTTLSLEVKYLRPITVDTGRVRVIGEVEHRGRRQATAVAHLKTIGEGKLLASGTSTCMIL